MAAVSVPGADPATRPGIPELAHREVAAAEPRTVARAGAHKPRPHAEANLRAIITDPKIKLLLREQDRPQ